MAKKAPKAKANGRKREEKPPKVYEHTEEKLLLRPDVGLQA